MHSETEEQGILRSLRFMWRPLQFPEWGEYLLAVMGLLQFIFAMAVFSELEEKPGLVLTVLLSPWAWSIAGLIIFIQHTVAMKYGSTAWGYNLRLVAVASSLVFWSHFILSTCMNAVFFGGPFHGSMVPALGTPLLASAVLYRLWRRY